MIRHSLAGLAWSLVLSVAVVASGAAPSNPMPYPPLPEGISSFGATEADGWIYVFGGHMGRVPGNSKAGLSPHFCRLNAASPAAQWEELPIENSSQSPGLVAWKGKVYRVGGLSFDNQPGEATVYHSLNLFTQFDPQTKAWTALPALPAPRSSLDAAVVDGQVYVIGGWDLQGADVQSAPWHEDAIAFDLAKENSQWTPIAKPPFQTRALAVAAHNHKLYVLGGMKSSNQTTKDVYIYDPQADTWAKGPELKSSNMFGGFAISAFATGGKLYYCGGDGTVYGLNDAGDDWQPVERLIFSRMFHRVVPVSDDKLAVIAGVSGGSYLASVEVVSVGKSDPARVKSVAWSVSFPGTARHSQVLLLNGASLYAFGGNRSPNPHDFHKEAFANEAFRFDLAARTVETLPNLPQPVQSGAAFLAGSRIDQSIYVMGGLSPDGEKYHSSDVIQQYRLRSKAWSEELQHLPGSRAMFGLGTHAGTAWIFGGSQVKTAMSGLSAETWQWTPTNEEPPTVVPDAAIPTPRRSFGGTVLDGKYYAVGGLGDKNEIVDSASVFDLETRKWSEIAAPKLARVFPSLAAAGGKLYLAGGFSKVDGHFAGTTEVEVYDPKTKTWSSAFQELAPTLAEMTMLEFQDRLLFYSIDKDQPGTAHFVLVDPNPQAVGFAAMSMGAEERSGSAELAQRLLRLDRNKDGQLTKDEVGARFHPIIDKVDTNKDGTASKEEIEAYLQQEEAAARASASETTRPAATGAAAAPRTGEPKRD